MSADDLRGFLYVNKLTKSILDNLAEESEFTLDISLNLKTLKT